MWYVVTDEYSVACRTAEEAFRAAVVALEWGHLPIITRWIPRD
jgi:hypothetical protein